MEKKYSRVILAGMAIVAMVVLTACSGIPRSS